MDEQRDYIVNASGQTVLTYRVRASSGEDALERFADGDIIHSESVPVTPDSAHLEE